MMEPLIESNVSLSFPLVCRITNEDYNILMIREKLYQNTTNCFCNIFIENTLILRSVQQTESEQVNVFRHFRIIREIIFFGW